ncbi:Crp/Fnr family transcriptional regulator [Robertkochia solimangrovi]|uniref:Crp/Fnr family transcriptional regulator n=1 Tax=Robertkochia solimangrovi TaxID=2213046 RepID=UPI00117F9AC6|nr:Crp/Fnr family transcriptional regulator [Robertkochia solimangrovi]TRZ43493.1 Crp/Fnr family transcriptional regulator [Robertkochia solimangrovi]
MITELKENYGYLFEDELLQEINEAGMLKFYEDGSRIIEIGDYIKFMPLLLSGAVKIMRDDGDGDELLLYFLERGDTCAMTLTCCLGNKKSEIRAVAEGDTELIMIPIEKMEEWMTKYHSWRSFVLNSYHHRLDEMLETIDSLVFLRMDERLLKYLRDKAKVLGNDLLNTTHQQIAYDLHTSRVVVSRLLKSLEKKGQIKLHRNYISVLDL